MFVLVILGIVVFILIRRNKGVKDFKNRVPNFISFCKKNGWDLVAGETTGLMFCKEVDYKKLKTEYFKVHKVKLELPEDMIIYHYIGLYCGGDFTAISSDNRDFSNFRFINYLTVPNFRPGKFPKKTLMRFNDDNLFYENQIEIDWKDIARDLFRRIQCDEKNRNGIGGGWYSLYMKDSEIKQWNNLANDPEVPLSLRLAITELFIPYKISIVKFNVNLDATSDPYRYFIYDENTLFSKSLRTFQQDPTLKAFGYPDWFYLAFPDVAIWAIRGDGNKTIKEQFKDLSENDLVSNRSIRLEHLKTIISLYIHNVKRPLEVSVNSDY